MSIPKSIPEQRHRAARVLAANARNADDLAELLDMLGLNAADGLLPPTSATGTAPIPDTRRPSEAERGLATTLLAEVIQSLR